jgi:hypothetical protein
MEWVPLLIISCGNSRIVHLLKALSLPLLALLLLSNRKDKLTGSRVSQSRFLQLLLAHC